MPDPRPPTISVVVPSYHRAASLDRCLAALEQLVRPPAETIVVARPEDGLTADVARRRGVRLVPTVLPGLAAAMQAGADAAGSDVLAFTDDDAEPAPDWTQRIEQGFLRNTRLGALGGRDAVVGDRDEPISSSSVGRITWYGRIIGGHHRGRGPAVPVTHLKGVNLAVRRDVFSGLHLDALVRGRGAQYGNELFVCLTASRRGWEVRYDPQLVVVHHAEVRADGTARNAISRAQIRADATNVTLSALLFGTQSQRLAVPLFVAAVGERVRPGLAAGLAMAAAHRDPRVLLAMLQVWLGVTDAMTTAIRRGIGRPATRGPAGEPGLVSPGPDSAGGSSSVVNGRV